MNLYFLYFNTYSYNWIFKIRNIIMYFLDFNTCTYKQKQFWYHLQNLKVTPYFYQNGQNHICHFSRFFSFCSIFPVLQCVYRDVGRSENLRLGGGASSNVVGKICLPGWDMVNIALPAPCQNSPTFNGDSYLIDGFGLDVLRCTTVC